MVTQSIGRIAAMCVLVAGVGLSGSVTPAQTPEEIFQRGNSAYERGDHGEAVAAYETLLKYRIRDPRVEFNLGNAQFRLGNLGQTILHFERALQMDPTDPEIAANLEYVRSFCVDRVEPPELPALVGFVQNLQDRVGPDRQAWLGLGILWAIAALVAWGFARPGRWSAGYGWALAALVLAGALFAGSWFATYQRLEGRELAVVLDATVEVLAGPGENNATLFTVHEGLTLEIRSRRQEWIQVTLPNGLNGWLAERSVGIV